MKWKSRYRRLKIYAQYFPFTLNFFIVATALWAAWYALHQNEDDAKDNAASFQPLVMMMGKVAMWFVVALLGISLLSTVACWLYYLIAKRKKNITLQVAFGEDTKRRGLIIDSLLEKVRRPFLGFIKGRLIYDGAEMTDRFVLAGNKKAKGKFWRDAVTGKSVVELPGIKEYAITGGFVFFEDMLQLLSLPVRQQVNGHFYKDPELQLIEAREAIPRKTDETEIRIEQMRRVNGDYFHYKDFEHGDDVRRIVWKLYAKNRELVVRTPEIFNPFASHICFYASFYTVANSLQRENAFAEEMLNYYKQRVWTAYETLAKKDFEVKYIADQHINVAEIDSKTEQVKRIISGSVWQTDNLATDYFEPRYGAVICISSMNNVEDVAQMLDQCSHETVVYYTKLSDCFKSFAPLTWLLRIFVKPPKDRLKRLKSRWIFAPLRLQLIKREKQIEELLNKSNVIHGKL